MHESADLTGLKKADVDHVKAFARRQTDRARPAYGHVLVKQPRRNIDWATTNDEVYLQSQTGNRCFWPLICGKIDIKGLQRDRLQLLGEAAHYESKAGEDGKGESVVLDEALWPDAKAEQEKRRVIDPWEDKLANIPDTVNINQWSHSRGFSIEKDVQIIHRQDAGLGMKQETVSSAVLLEHLFGLPIGHQLPVHSMRLSRIMKLLGWQRPEGALTIGDQRVRGYCRTVEV